MTSAGDEEGGDTLLLRLDRTDVSVRVKLIIC